MKYKYLLLFTSLYLGFYQLGKAQDTIPPEINLNTPNTICHKVHTPYNMVQPTATDNISSSSQISLTLISSDVDPNSIGTYQDIFKAIDGAGNQTTKIRIVNVMVSCGTADLQQVMKDDLMLYPNPASNTFSIGLKGGDDLLLAKVIAADGKTVIEKTGTAGMLINSEELANGIYTVSVWGQSGCYMQKLVVQHW